jgi:Tol biopolymer transport system component
MKNYSLIFLMFACALCLNACGDKKNASTNNDSLTTKTPAKVDKPATVASPYLGQKSPGLTPKLFAPEIIKTEFREAAAAFSPDLKEFYFRRRGGKYKHNTLVMVQQKDNRWVESLVARKAGEPFISPDGKTLHLGRRYRERTDTGWSELKSLAAPFKDMRIMRLTTSAKGTYYFDEASETGPLHYSRLVDGKHEKPQKVNVNVGKWNAHPFIAPDESYLIWDDQRNGNADLYVSFRQKDGSWGEAINLGDQINTPANEAYGSVTPDGKYFFFHRSTGGGNADIYWVDAQIIKKLRPKE